MTDKIVDKAYRFRIIPTKNQEELIIKNIGCSRFIYNHFLAKAKEDKYQSYTKYAAELPEMKEHFTKRFTVKIR